MTQAQWKMLLAMLWALRVALLEIVTAIEVVLITEGMLDRKTSDIRKLLKAQGICDTMAVVK
ncbi:hypothetical protein ANRL3_00655 [Anaerolineae bacterium]|nr:hypothetical protein ANRL3_00655 [Anaerolineae bacterium]